MSKDVLTVQATLARNPVVVQMIEDGFGGHLHITVSHDNTQRERFAFACRYRGVNSNIPVREAGSKEIHDDLTPKEHRGDGGRELTHRCRYEHILPKLKISEQLAMISPASTSFPLHFSLFEEVYLAIHGDVVSVVDC